MKAYRQGDVILLAIPPLAENEQRQFLSRKPNSKGHLVLAEGEVTGHAHVLEKTRGVELLHTTAGDGSALLVVKEATVKRGDFIEGKVIGTMPGGTIRFQQTDGNVIRFRPGDITMRGDAGVVVNLDYHPLRHDEHDAIPVPPGTYEVIQEHTADAMMQRRRVED